MKLPILTLTVLVTAIVTADPGLASERSVNIFVSPHLREEERNEARDHLLELVLQDAKPETGISIKDGWSGEMVTSFFIPVLKYDGVKARRKLLKDELAAMLGWFTQKPEASPLSETGALNVPKIANLLRRGDDEVTVLVGSPIYRDLTNPRASWRQEDGPQTGLWYPSDAFLFAGDGGSPWAVDRKNKRLSGIHLHWLLMGDTDFGSDAYRAKVERFYTLFFQLNGGKLMTFLDDPGEVFRSMWRSDFNIAEYQINPSHTSLMMLRTEQEINFATFAETTDEVSVPLDLLPKTVKRMILVDITASMQRAYPLVARQVAMMPAGENMLLITYSDHDSPRVVTVFEESDDPAVVSRSLRSIELESGGSDLPEALGDALRAARDELTARGVQEPVQIEIWTDAPAKAAEDTPTGIDYKEEIQALLAAGHQLTLYRCRQSLETQWVPQGVTIKEVNHLEDIQK